MRTLRSSMLNKMAWLDQKYCVRCVYPGFTVHCLVYHYVALSLLSLHLDWQLAWKTRSKLAVCRITAGCHPWCSTALLLLEGVTTRVLCGENRTNYASCSPYFLVTLATIATLGIIARPPLGSRQLSAIIPPSPPSLPPPTSVWLQYAVGLKHIQNRFLSYNFQVLRKLL